MNRVYSGEFCCFCDKQLDDLDSVKRPFSMTSLVFCRDECVKLFNSDSAAQEDLSRKMLLRYVPLSMIKGIFEGLRLV